MLIEQKETRMLILPKIVVKNDPKKGHFSKTRRLIPGINEVANDYWAMAKEQTTIKRKLEAGLLVELVEKSDRTEKMTSAIDKMESSVKEKEKIIEKQKREAKKTRDKIKKAEINEDIEVKEEELEEEKEKLHGKKTSLNKELSNFSNLTQKKKEKIVKECFDVELLEKWYENETELLKGIIRDRVSTIKKGKTLPNIGKPHNTI